MVVSNPNPVSLELALAIRLAQVLDVKVHVYGNDVENLHTYVVVYHNGEREELGSLDALYKRLNAMAQAKRALDL